MTELLIAAFAYALFRALASAAAFGRLTGRDPHTTPTEQLAYRVGLYAGISAALAGLLLAMAVA